VAAFGWIAVLAMLAFAPAASAGSLGVAWDRSDAEGVTGYRVFVGTVPGQPSEMFEVGAHQTSFIYVQAVQGQVYYFSVATMARGLVGSPSLEVSGRAAIAGSDTGASAAVARPAMSVDPALTELGGSLAGVSSLRFSPEGLGLFIEGDSTIRILGPGGLASDPAYQAAAGERFLSLALHPQFSANGYVYATLETALPDRRVERRVVRYRLVGGRLGEAATLVVGFPPTGDRAELAIAPDKHILVAQAGRVLRFTLDGNTPLGSADSTWAAVDVDPVAAMWDDTLGGLWVVGRERSGGIGARFVESGQVSRTSAVTSASQVVESIAVSALAGRVYAHATAGGVVTSIDLAGGTVRSPKTPHLAVPLVGWTAAPDGAAYVVAEADSQPTAYALLRHVAAAPRIDTH
jgi:hypothetical protein